MSVNTAMIRGRVAAFVCAVCIVLSLWCVPAVRKCFAKLLYRFPQLCYRLNCSIDAVCYAALVCKLHTSAEICVMRVHVELIILNQDCANTKSSVRICLKVESLRTNS